MQKLREVNFAKEGRQLVIDYVMLTLGTLLAALSFAWFFLPYSIAPGGVSGIAMVLAHYLPIGVGMLTFVINVPLFVLGWKNVGWRFAVRSFVAMTLMSAFIEMFPAADVAGDIMLASIFGGVLLGVGLGMVVRAGATTGGTDMAAQMIHNAIGFVSVATVLLAIDAMVVTIAAMVFGMEAALWALITLVVSSKAMDMIIKGFNTAMQFVIISRYDQQIVGRIHEDLERGCTRLMAEGTYSRRPVGMLLCVVSRTQAPRLKKIVAEIDPNAFVTVCNVHEALGYGFTGEEEPEYPEN